MRLKKPHPVRDLQAKDTAQDIDANFDAVYKVVNEIVNRLLPRTEQRLTVPLQTKGDLLGHSGVALARLVADTDGYVLTADSAEPIGFAWREAAGPTGDGYWTILTDGDLTAAEPIYADGDVIAMFIPLP